MLELMRLWSVFRDNRKLIGVLTTIIAAALLNVFLLIPPKYHGIVKVLIDPLGLQVVEKDLTPRSRTADSQFAVVESQMRVMASDVVLRTVISSQQLASDPEFGSKKNLLGFGLSDILYNLVGIEPQVPDLKALRRLWRAVWTEREKGSYVVNLVVKTKDPGKSARIANSIAATYVKLEFSERADMARRASGALMDRLEELRNRLREAEDRVEKYKAANNIIDAEGKLVNEQQLTQINKELSTVRGERSRAQSRYEQIKLLLKTNASPGAIAEAVKSETIKELRVRFAAALQAEMSLTSQLMPAHPDVQRARARVRTVRGEISNELARIAEAARIDYEHAKGNEKDLTRKVETLKNTALSTNDAQVKMRELKRDAEASRLVYNSFLVRARELGEQQGVDSTRARIISPAIPPRKPAGLSLPAAIAIFVIIAFALSAFFVLLRDSVCAVVRRGYD